MLDIGRGRAFAGFSRPDGGFVDREPSASCQDVSGVVVTHGATHLALVVTGPRSAVRMVTMIRVRQAQGRGRFEYLWPNPWPAAFSARSPAFSGTTRTKSAPTAISNQQCHDGGDRVSRLDRQLRRHARGLSVATLCDQSLARRTHDLTMLRDRLAAGDTGLRAATRSAGRGWRPGARGRGVLRQ